MRSLPSLALLSCCALTIAQTTADPPYKWGYLAFPNFTGLDIFGPLEFYGIGAFSTRLDMAIIASDLSFVPSTAKTKSGHPTAGVMPTSTFNDPKSYAIDVLIIPGGAGSRVAIKDQMLLDYVREVGKTAKYVLSNAGLHNILGRQLDGKRATTNKFSWREMVQSCPDTIEWVPKARWVVDGNIWTSSGVTAGMDMIHALYQPSDAE
ncbi:class I glutamine amidotransferase-like protein [Atractiella rhizophila]|nr:class I glutamine amidotransferase-like protein [Atractiella rhizophila]